MFDFPLRTDLSVKQFFGHYILDWETFKTAIVISRNSMNNRTDAKLFIFLLFFRILQTEGERKWRKTNTATISPWKARPCSFIPILSTDLWCRWTGHYSQMNTRQILIFFIFSKVIWHFVWLFTCFVKFVNASVNLKLFCFHFCNKNNFTFLLASANLTKCVNQHCRAWEILKKISIRLVFI